MAQNPLPATQHKHTLHRETLSTTKQTQAVHGPNLCAVFSLQLSQQVIELLLLALIRLSSNVITGPEGAHHMQVVVRLAVQTVQAVQAVQAVQG